MRGRGYFLSQRELKAAGLPPKLELGKFPRKVQVAFSVKCARRAAGHGAAPVVEEALEMAEAFAASEREAETVHQGYLDATVHPTVKACTAGMVEDDSRSAAFAAKAAIYAALEVDPDVKMADTSVCIDASCAAELAGRKLWRTGLSSHAAPDWSKIFAPIRRDFRLFKRLVEEFDWNWKSGIPRKLFNGPRVFICHSGEDEVLARTLAGDLKESGLRPWLAEDGIDAGDDVIPALEAGIAESRFVIVVLTSSFTRQVARAKGYRSALRQHLKRGHPTLIPVLLEDCQAPGFLATKQAVDLHSDYEQGLDRLLFSITKQWLTE